VTVTSFTTASGMGPLPRLVEDAKGARAVERVFRAEGLPLWLAHDQSSKIPLRSMMGLMERAAREMGDELFGLNLGSAMRPEDYGPFIARWSSSCAWSAPSTCSRRVQSPSRRSPFRSATTTSRASPAPSGNGPEWPRATSAAEHPLTNRGLTRPKLPAVAWREISSYGNRHPLSGRSWFSPSEALRSQSARLHLKPMREPMTKSALAIAALVAAFSTTAFAGPVTDEERQYCAYD
jgi:Arabinose-binding domain of AraC transcription regulator, N-term